MSFLFPAAWAGLVLALPVIALYLIRTRLERRTVSTLLFWDQIPTQSYNSALWRKLRRWLSLLLQLLFLLLIVLALTQPLAPWQSALPSRTVFVLDPSASMSAREGDETRWERALAILRQRIGQMRAFDQAAILVAGEPPEVLSGWTASRRVLNEALSRARPVSEQVSLRPALALAGNLQATQSNSSVVLLTDGVWRDGEEVSPEVERLWIGESQPNVGITHFSARRSLASPGDVRLSAEVVSHAEEPVQGVIEVVREGRLLDAQDLTLSPGQQWEREWDVRAEEASLFEVRLVDFPPDALPADDGAQARAEEVPPVQVLLVSETNAFLEAALSALPLVEWGRVEPGVVPEFPDAKTLYVFHRTAPPAAYEKANVLLINPPEEGFWGKPLGAVDQPLVSEVAKDEILMRHTGFARVALEAATKWEKPPAAEVWADSFGDPLIYGQWGDLRRWALLAFDLEGSDWVLRTAFPIFLGNAVESLRPGREISASTAPGKTETALARTAAESEPTAPSASGSSGWWLAFPLWWWAVCLGCLWLLGEWGLFTRRITE